MRQCGVLLASIAAVAFQVARSESLEVDATELHGGEVSHEAVIDILEDIPDSATQSEVADTEPEELPPSDMPPEVAPEPQYTPPWVPAEPVGMPEGLYPQDSDVFPRSEDTLSQRAAVQQLPPRPSRPKLLWHRLVARVRQSRLLRWFRVHIVHIVALACLVAAVALAAGVYIRRRDGRRFLTTTRLSIADKEVQRACNYIEKNYADPGLCTESICDVLVSGAAFLHALFQRELGMSPEDFIAQVRMNRARIILGENSEVDPDELAASVGYRDNSAFSRKFLEITGISVEDYRAHV